MDEIQKEIAEKSNTLGLIDFTKWMLSEAKSLPNNFPRKKEAIKIYEDLISNLA